MGIKKKTKPKAKSLKSSRKRKKTANTPTKKSAQSQSGVIEIPYDEFMDQLEDPSLEEERENAERKWLKSSEYTQEIKRYLKMMDEQGSDPNYIKAENEHYQREAERQEAMRLESSLTWIGSGKDLEEVVESLHQYQIGSGGAVSKMIKRALATLTKTKKRELALPIPSNKGTLSIRRGNKSMEERLGPKRIEEIKKVGQRLMDENLVTVNELFWQKDIVKIFAPLGHNYLGKCTLHNKPPKSQIKKGLKENNPNPKTYRSEYGYSPRSINNLIINLFKN